MAAPAGCLEGHPRPGGALYGPQEALGGSQAKGHCLVSEVFPQCRIAASLGVDAWGWRWSELPLDEGRIRRYLAALHDCILEH